MRKAILVPAFAFALSLSSAAFAEPAGQYIDDATITTKAKAALLSDSRLKAIHVSVETTDGVVKLTGKVTTKDQEAEALRVVNQVGGVKSVNDLLTVRGTQEE